MNIRKDFRIFNAGSWKCVYYPDHDKRYAHIHWTERSEYPDAVIVQGLIGEEIVVERKKPFKELDWGDVPELEFLGIDIRLAACDVPLKDCQNGAY